MYRKGIIKRMLAATLTAVMLLSSAPSTLVNAAQLPETVISDVAEEQSEEATEMLSGNEITGDETPDNETSEDPTEADSDKTGGGGGTPEGEKPGDKPLAGGSVSDNDTEEDKITDDSVSDNEISENEATDDTVSDNDTEKETMGDSVSDNDLSGEGSISPDNREYQYISFPKNRNSAEIILPEREGITLLENLAETVSYRIDTEVVEELVFEAVTDYGHRLIIPEQFRETMQQKQERRQERGGWIYSYGLSVQQLDTTAEKPAVIRLIRTEDMISVKVNGNAIMEGIDESGMAQRGSRVMIEVTEPGYTLAKLTKDDKGNDVYTAMKLNYDNQYEFTAEEAAEFYVVDPEKAAYIIAYSNTRQAKLIGAAGLKLTGLTSSAQSYNEIVLNFNAVKNGSDGTETEAAYYEVKVTALPKEGEHLPAGSSTTPKYYYIPKVANQNTQSKSIIVNDGDLAAPTACTYGFSVRMVLLDRTKTIDESTPLTEPLTVSLEGNSLTKSFATKGMLYYEDKISFTKKKTAIYSGEQNILAGTVKYSKNASYIHDLTAYAYDSRGEVVPQIACSFQNDNDELYVSAEPWLQPGKYKIIVYAGIGEKDATSGKPQGGTMYQSNTSFTLTIYSGIGWIDVDNISDRVFVHSKDVTFSAVPIGYGPGGKAKTQKFTYEIQGAELTGDEYGYTRYTATDPNDNIKNNVTVNKSGKVTVKKGFYVDPDTSKNRIAVVIKAADYEGNTTENVKFVEISATALIPTEIYLTDSKGNKLGTTLSADRAEWANVVVLDQNGNNMNAYAVITPNSSKGAAYVDHSVGSDYAWMYVNKPTTVSIKATATDGSKKSKTVKIQITIPYVSETAYLLWDISSNGFSIPRSDIQTEKGRVTYHAPKGAVIEFKNGAKINDTGYYKRAWFNWGYSVTGGKLKFDGDNWLLTPTAKTAQVRIWMKSNPKKYWYVNFTNTNWDTNYEKPPTVKLVSGKLYSDRYSNESELRYYEDEDGEIYSELPKQELTYQYEYGSYDQVEIAQLSSAGPGIVVEDFDPMNRTFRLSTYSSYLRPGSYKYSIAFYNNGQLMSKPATITVKVNKSAPVKVTASYTLNTALGQSVALKSTPTEFVPDYEALLNANIKGKANDFTKYFELAYNTNSVTGEKTAVIKLKDTVTPAELESIRGKKQTGYVKYSYYYGYSHVEHVTTKLTITVK